MAWTDIAFMLFLFAVAGFILYRALRKKKWCPAVFGSGDNTESKSNAEKSEE